jgi:hypothetical protein
VRKWLFSFLHHFLFLNFLNEFPTWPSMLLWISWSPGQIHQCHNERSL